MPRPKPATAPPSRLAGLSPQAVRYVIATAQALERGNADEADHHIVGALSLSAQHPEVLRLLAGIQTLRGAHGDALQTMQQAVALRPEDALYRNTLGSALLDAGDYDAAIAALRTACELDPTLRVAWYNLGLALMRCMRVPEAAAALRHAVDLAPRQSDARVILADLLRAEGHGGAAAQEYRRVIADNPHSGMAWWGLADLKSGALTAADAHTLRHALGAHDIGDADQIAMYFALARALEDHAQLRESLDAIASANRIARSHQTWRADAHTANVDAVLRAFTPPPAHADELLGSEVIFIASMPRSGSSLLEQILASHSQVEGAGELADLPLVLTEESQRRGVAFPGWVSAMQPLDWSRLGQRYLARTARWRRDRPRCIDKLPYNWFYAGAIRAMLPSAKILIARRDSLETCLSCYRQRLSNNEYTRTFADLADFWLDFDRAATHWRHLHPRHVLTSRLEDLVAHPEAHIRELLAFCELPFEAQCLDFQRTQREVHTPSAMQVRQPLRGDTARADRYGALLDPLRIALGLPPFVVSAQL